MENPSSFIEKWLSDPLVRQFVLAATGSILIYLAVRLIQRRFIDFYVKQPAMRHNASKAIALGGYVFAGLYVASIFSNQLDRLTVAFGVAGAGIAFALQELIASTAGWVILSFGHYYTVGDRIKIGETRGDVIDISVLRTTLMELGDWVDSDLYNGRVVRVPNSSVFKEAVFNYSSQFPYLWDELTIPIRYGGDYQLGRDVVLSIVHEITEQSVKVAQAYWSKIKDRYTVTDTPITPMVTLDIRNNQIELTVRYVVEYKERRAIKDKIVSRVLDEFQRSHGAVGYAPMTVHLVSNPELDEPGKPVRSPE